MNDSKDYLARLQQALNRQDDTLSPADDKMGFWSPFQPCLFSYR